MYTVSKTFKSPATTSLVTHSQVHHSVWFSVTPLPDNMWEVSVKEDAQPLLDRIASMVYALEP